MISKLKKWCWQALVWAFDTHPVVGPSIVILSIVIGMGFLVKYSIQDGCPAGFTPTSVPGRIRWIRPDHSSFETDGEHNECLKREVVK